MVKFANPDEKLWSMRIVHALAWRKLHTFEDSWPDIDRIYAHKFKDPNMPHFNLLYMMGQTLIPALVFQSPGIINVPISHQAVFGASVYDSLDNWWVRHSELKEISKEAVLSCYLHNTTATQIGYDFDTPSDDLRKDGEHNENLEKMPGVVDRTRATNAPWVDLIPSHRFLVAVGTRTMRNCDWAAKLVSAPVSSLKKIKGLNKRALTGTKMPDEVYRQETSIWEKRDTEKYCHFWEIHDAGSGKWMWLTTAGNFLLPPETDPLQVAGLPFEVTSFNRNTNSIWGTPDAIYVRSQMMEGDECRRLAMFQRRMATPKCFYNQNVIKAEEIQRIMSAEVGAGIGVDCPTDVDISKVILPIVPPTANYLYSAYQKDLLNDAQLINGFGPNQMGTFAPGRRTKYETQVVESSNTTRLAFRRFEVGEIFRGHTTRANYLIADNWTQPLVQQVVGVDGSLYWVKASAQEIKSLKAGLVTEVNVESLAPVSRERRKMEALELIKLLGTMQQAGANPMPILKQLLSTYEWVDVRQVLPQMYGEMSMNEFQGQQEQAIQAGGVGQRAAQNMQGVMSLAQKAPEMNTITGDQANDGEAATQG